MANVKIRAASMYVKGKKAAEFEGTSYDISSGDEAQFGDPGYVGHSDGATTTKLSATGVMPVAGQTVDLVGAMLRKEDVDIALSLINGKIHQIPMRVTNASVKSSHKNGTQTGDFTLEGGEPRMTG